MKYICLAYIQPGKFENMTENERHAMLDECFDYDDQLRANGHFAAGEALEPRNATMTLYWKNGKVAVPTVRTPRLRNNWAESWCLRRTI